MTDTALKAPETGHFSHRQIMVIMSGLLLGTLLAALDQTIVATSMRTIADQLHGQTYQAWATTAYLITSTISTPLYGKLSDIYGRKPFYLTAISIFLVGSVLCGIATSMYELAGFRALQGLGAGGLFSLAFAIIGDIVSPRERGRYQGFFVAVFGLASVLGPVVGGALSGMDSLFGVTGWRWVFLVNLPIGVIALFTVTRALNLPHRRVDHRVDYLGAVTLAVGVVPLLVVAEQGREWGWLSTRALGLIALGVAGLVAFAFAERKMGDEALIPPRMFARPVFRVANSLNFVTGMGMFGGMAALPLYLQIVKGYPPTKAGLMLLPLMVGIMISSIGSGQLISRSGRYKFLPVIGIGLMTVAMALFSTVTVDTPLGRVMGGMFLMGLGLGLCFQTLVLAVQNDLPAADMGVATASVTFFRQMGGTAGTAVFLSILFGVVGDRIAEALARTAATPEFAALARDPAVLANPANRELLAGVTGTGSMPSLNDTSFLNQVDPRLARPFLEGFSSALGTVFLVGGLVLALGFVLSWFLREVPLRTESGIARRISDNAEREAAGDRPPGGPRPSGDVDVEIGGPTPQPAAGT